MMEGGAWMPALSTRRCAAIAAARAGLGTPFRPQGRIPGLGLDCIGVALLAADGAGVAVERLPAYALSGDHGRLLAETMAALGCRKVRRALPGDIVEYRLAPRHRHLAVMTATGIIHAHAGLGKMVEGPVPGDWAIAAIWALPGVG
jgi:murein DD-endopeptidase / murein LD-carboxypeptidase